MIRFFKFKRINKVDTVMGNYLSGRLNDTDRSLFIKDRYSKKLAIEVETNWNTLLNLLGRLNLTYKLVGYVEVITKKLIYKIRVSSIGFLYQTVDGLGRESNIEIVDIDDVDDFVFGLI